MSGTRGAVTLSELLGSKVRVEPWEAVAILRSVITNVRESGAESSIPELHEIQLAADGQVRVSGGVKTGEPVRRLGQLLQALLTHSAPPVQLRLLISEATAPESPYTSIDDYGSALGYFERPDRDANMRALYARAAAEPIVASPLPTIDAMAPLTPKAGVEAKKDAARAGARRVATVLVVAGVLAFVCLASVIAASRLRSAHQTSSVSQAVVQASDAVGSALLSGASAVTERAGLGRLVSASQSAAAPPVSNPARATASKPPRAIRRDERSAPITAGVAFDLDGVPVAEEAEPLVTESLALVRPSEVIPYATAALDLRIYNPQSDGVRPPISVRPRLPRELPAHVAIQDLSRIELIVLEDGTVGSVRLLGTEHPVPDAMMLSAAKTWEFKPALKDGHPVKYRKILWMARH